MHYALPPIQLEHLRLNYGPAGGLSACKMYLLKLTADPKEVTCPECKQTWEYIEASINEK